MTNTSQGIRELIDFFIAIGAWVVSIFAVITLFRVLIIPYLPVWYYYQEFYSPAKGSRINNLTFWHLIFMSFLAAFKEQKPRNPDCCRDCDFSDSSDIGFRSFYHLNAVTCHRYSPIRYFLLAPYSWRSTLFLVSFPPLLSTISLISLFK